jgi:hypothetical protein
MSPYRGRPASHRAGRPRQLRDKRERHLQLLAAIAALWAKSTTCLDPLSRTGARDAVQPCKNLYAMVRDLLRCSLGIP